MGMPNILVVDDDRDCRRMLVRVLQAHYRVMDVASAEIALELLLTGYSFDVILCDMGMDGWSGADLYKRLQRKGNPHAARFVMLTGEDVAGRNPALASQLIGRLLRKPVDPAELLEVLTTIRRVAQQQSETWRPNRHPA